MNVFIVDIGGNVRSDLFKGIRGKQQNEPVQQQIKKKMAPPSYLGKTLLKSSTQVEAGPTLNIKNREKVQTFVDKMGGKRPIQRVLIANNGMAATKSIMSMRQWAYVTLGDERAIEFVAMASRADLNANAEFIRLADSYVEVPDGNNKNNYANVDLIISIAEEQKVDAVWPGWGHASENPKLPSGLAAKGIQFIGPTAPVMAALGDKVSANILAQTADVPSIPWSGGGIKSALDPKTGEIPKDIFDSACVFNADQAAESAAKIGYPVMIKASEGGGGKGIRMVDNEADLRTNFLQVQNEVPGSPIFMMQLCTNARHLEVQIVGDEYGNAVALNGRDCSTQRRFQKIFEEGPPTIAKRDIFRQMELSAQRLTQSIGYIGAGTVEYLYNVATDEYYFLELNPRLQVEHPVTEGLTGVNLPSVQLQVAMGIPLERIPQIRSFYGKDVDGTDSIDFMTEMYKYPEHHIIAARITAENPDEGFKPTSGRIERVKFQSTPKVWGYFSVGANGGIHEFADSQFGHIFASGPTREDARKSLVLALKEIDVRGDIRNPLDYLIKLLETPEFKDNTIDTAWLDGIIREKSVSVDIEPDTVALSAAIFKSHIVAKSKYNELAEALKKGQTSLQGISSLLSFPIEITFNDVKYKFQTITIGPDHYRIQINDQNVDVRIREQPDQSLLCSVGNDNWQLFGQEEALGLRMKVNGVTVMIPTVFNPSELRSDVTGKVVRFLQQDGDSVEKDQPYVEVEAMKMIMSIKAGESGVISHNLQPGSILGAGDLIASLQLKDPSKVKKISAFTGPLTTLPGPQEQTVEDSIEALTMAMAGYESDNIEQSLQSYLDSGSPSGDAEKLFSELMNNFLAAEKDFIGQDESAVIGNLAKNNKDDLMSTVPTLLARNQLKPRAKVVVSILRQIEFFPQKFNNYKISSMTSELKESLIGISDLDGPIYGELSLKAKQILDESAVPDFEVRLQTLKDKLKIKMSTADLSALAKEPDIAVSVDLLVELLRDSDEGIRRAAMEVYIRRVHRANCVTNLTYAEENGVIQCKWDFNLREKVEGEPMVRKGIMVVYPDFQTSVDKATELAIMNNGFGDTPTSSPLNSIQIAFLNHGKLSDNECAAKAQMALAPYQAQLKKNNVRSVSYVLVNPEGRVSYYNFNAESNWIEDEVLREMRPTMPYLLELNRLKADHSLKKMPTVGRNAYVFLGEELVKPTGQKGPTPQVLFLRAISLSSQSVTPGGAERLVIMGLDEIERASLDPRITSTTSSRIFVNVIADVAEMTAENTISSFKEIMDKLISKYANRILKLRVDEIEVKIRVRDENGDIIPIRLIASSSTGGWLTREAYREVLDPVSGQTLMFCTLNGNKSVCVENPYPTSNVLQQKRNIARRVGSTYASDFLGLMEVSLINVWEKYMYETKSSVAPPPAAFAFDELVLQSDGELAKEKRFPGTNKVGMLAWHITMKTPQYPGGRDVVVIANDVTVQSGSFGVLEDEFFFKASEYARLRGLPRVFISCNSGARIGLVDDLKPKFKVAWKDESNPLLGFDYLYLAEADYNSLPEGTVDATLKTVNGENQYVLDAIIGQIHGIGVENLRGSGLIAGETSRAYDETFTLSYVTGRSVGIGAYLNRLGQRVIQMQQGPIILTGYSALNKLLGKEVSLTLNLSILLASCVM